MEQARRVESVWSNPQEGGVGWSQTQEGGVGIEQAKRIELVWSKPQDSGVGMDQVTGEWSRYRASLRRVDKYGASQEGVVGMELDTVE